VWGSVCIGRYFHCPFLHCMDLKVVDRLVPLRMRKNNSIMIAMPPVRRVNTGFDSSTQVWTLD
jgi:hypothetical protein